MFDDDPCLQGGGGMVEVALKPVDAPYIVQDFEVLR